jgi:GT2 family glycosyltransferase
MFRSHNADGRTNDLERTDNGVDLSVVIVNWNTRELVLRCLEHLLGLDLPAVHEIWVVDNGSTDGSCDAIRSGFPQVALLANSRNLGFAAANNQALGRVRGQYALLLNSDCFPQPGSIPALLDAMAMDSRVGIAGGALVHPDGRPQNSFGATPSLASELLPKGLLQWLWPERFPSKRRPPSGPTEVGAVLGAFLMVRRAAWEQVGGLDEGFFFFMEETDWCLRMGKAGWKVIHVPGARAVHLLGGSASRDSVGARVEFHRSRYRFFALHRGRTTERLLRAGIFIGSVTNWASSGVLSRLPGARGNRWRARHRIDGEVLRWHFLGCPDHGGLSRDSSER